MGPYTRGTSEEYVTISGRPAYFAALISSSYCVETAKAQAVSVATDCRVLAERDNKTNVSASTVLPEVENNLGLRQVCTVVST